MNLLNVNEVLTHSRLSAAVSSLLRADMRISPLVVIDIFAVMFKLESNVIAFGLEIPPVIHIEFISNLFYYCKFIMQLAATIKQRM